MTNWASRRVRQNEANFKGSFKCGVSSVKWTSPDIGLPGYPHYSSIPRFHGSSCVANVQNEANPKRSFKCEVSSTDRHGERAKQSQFLRTRAERAKRSQFQAVPGGRMPGRRGPWRAIAQNEPSLAPGVREWARSGKLGAPAGVDCTERSQFPGPTLPLGFSVSGGGDGRVYFAATCRVRSYRTRSVRDCRVDAWVKKGSQTRHFAFGDPNPPYHIELRAMRCHDGSVWGLPLSSVC